MKSPSYMVWVLAGSCLLSLANQTLGGSVYWTDRKSGQVGVRRMGLDGALPTTASPLLSVSGDPRGIALEVEAERFYFGNTSVIVRANLDGTGAANVISGQSAVRDLVLEPSTGHLYWCDQTGVAPGGVVTGGTIRRAPLSTFVVDPVDWKQAPDAYYLDIFMGSPTSRIVWGNSGTQCLTTLLDGATAPAGAWNTTGQNVRGVGVDDAARMVYWCERDAKAIFRAPMDASGIPQLAAKESLFTGLDTPHGLKLDAKARRVYWADSGTNSGVGAGDSGIGRGSMDPPFGAPEVLIGSANAAAAPRTTFATQAWDLDLDLRTPTFAEWQARFFKSTDAEAVKGPLADPDLDSLVNLLEFALGTAPRIPDQAAVSATVEKASGRVLLTFPRRKHLSGTLVFPQLSLDLQSWLDDVKVVPPVARFEEVSAVPLPGGEDLEMVTVRTGAAYAFAGRLFVRVMVE